MAFVAIILSSGYNFKVYLHHTIYLHLLKEVQYLHENSYKLQTNTISYKHLLDEIPDDKLFKICTTMPKWN